MADETQDQTTTEATPPIAETPRPTVDEGATVLPAMGDENAPDDWQPPQHLPDGTPVDGNGLPINLRLRKAALVDAGETSDPAGSLSDADIAAEKDRLASYDAEYPPVAGLKTAELEKLAKAEDVDISSATTNQERGDLILAARPARV